MHVEGENIMRVEDEIFLGQENKFTGETSQRGSSNTNEVYFKILNIRLQLGF